MGRRVSGGGRQVVERISWYGSAREWWCQAEGAAGVVVCVGCSVAAGGGGHGGNGRGRGATVGKPLQRWWCCWWREPDFRQATAVVVRRLIHPGAEALHPAAGLGLRTT
eukprot:364540-Chlamydomonas_euryale.AAC.8